MSKRIHIAIAEPSVIIRSGLVAVMQRISSLNIDIAEISDIFSLGEQITRLNPDILIVNPVNLGLVYASKLKNETNNSFMKIIALQNSLSDNMVLQSYDAVISIYDSADKIKEAIINLVNKEKKSDVSKELSVREKEIIVCIVKGMTNKLIADQLCISTHTVIAHRRNITSKLQINSSSGLTIYAIVNKLVDISEIQDLISKEE